MGLNKSQRKRRNYERDYFSEDTLKRVYHQKEKEVGRMSGADGRANRGNQEIRTGDQRDGISEAQERINTKSTQTRSPKVKGTEETTNKHYLIKPSLRGFIILETKTENTKEIDEIFEFDTSKYYHATTKQRTIKYKLAY